MNRLKQLGKDGVVYGLGGVLARSIGFLVLPIYTRIFDPAQFGKIELLLILGGFFSTLVVLGTDSAQSFYFFKVKENGKQAQAEVVTAVLQWRLLIGIVLILLGMTGYPFLNEGLFESSLSSKYFLLVFAGALFGQILQQAADVMRLIFRPAAFVGVELARSILTAALIIGAAAYFELGVFGYVLGFALASFVTAGMGCFLMRPYLRGDRVYFEWWPKLLKFGLPLVPAALGLYLMNTTDRWVLQRFVGSEEVGIYAMGAKFAVAVGLAVQTFRKAWWPIALDAMHASDGPAVFRQVSVLYMGLGMAGAVYLAYLAPWLLSTFTTAPFWPADRIIAVLGFQAVLYGFYLIAAAGMWKREKTYFAAYLSGLGAICNLGLNFVLVPRFGGLGAAIATSCSYLLWCSATIWLSERLWKVHFPFLKLAGQLGGAAVTVAFILLQRDLGRSGVVEFLVVHIVTALLVITSVDTSLLERITKRVGWNSKDIR